MENRGFSDRAAKVFLIYLAFSAFLAIFAAIDTSEHYRAWKTALRWSDDQKASAPAQDVGRIYPLILLALAMDTAVIATSFVGGLSLGVSVAVDGGAAFKAAKVLAAAVSVLGLVYALSMIVYRILVWPRLVLKGPVFDYDMRLQVPIILAMAGFPVSSIAFRLKLASMRVSRPLSDPDE
ncbi:MAG TPA: hypothetical protein VIO60_06850 [Rectinemataceae bacterium]